MSKKYNRMRCKAHLDSDELVSVLLVNILELFEIVLQRLELCLQRA